MPGSTTTESKKMLLDYLTGRAVLYAAPRTTYLGLAFVMPIGENPTLLNISEVNTAGYGRVAIPWAAPTTDPVVQSSNADVQFPAFTADMASAADYAFLTDVAAGTGGSILYVWTLLEPVQAKAGKPIFIAAGAAAIQ